MRVIVLNDYGFVSGGAAQVVISSLNALAGEGIDVTFVSSVGPVDPAIDRNKVKVVNFGYYDLLNNPSRVQAATSGIWNSNSAAKFGHLLTEFDPRDTIIHLHTWVKSLSSSVVHVAIKRGFKVVCTLHDYFSICPNGGLYNYRQQKHCELSPMSFGCIACNCDSRSYGQKLWRVARQVVQKKFGNIPDGIKYFITVSDYAESLLRPRLPSTAKFFRVKNPIDIEKTIPTVAGSNDTFTFIGRLSPEKGCALLAVAAELAGIDAVFVGCGEEEQKIRAANPSVQLRGWQDRAGVILAMQSSRALVFPSLWHETQGLVVMEAAALGIPAIVSDGCAARDAVIDGETGLLFKAGNVDDLANKLKLLYDNPQLASRLGINAFERYWTDPCTLSSHVQELDTCYGLLLLDPS